MKLYNKTHTFITPATGYTLATPITCIAPPGDISFTEAAAITWYFGDGEKVTVNREEGLSATHVYHLPGTYSLTAVAYTGYSDGSADTAIAISTCKILNFIDESIYFTIIPPPTLPGYYTQYPYKIIFTTSRIETPPNIDLYSQFSRSYPPQENENKWSFVRPEWRFLDLSGNKIKSITPKWDTIKINSNGEFSNTGTVVGLTGSAEFYFIDDIYSVDLFIHDAPTPILWASMQTSAVNYYQDSDIKPNHISNFSTTEVRAFAPHVAYWKAPDYLKITETGVRDFINPRWVSASIPFFVSAQIDPAQVKKIQKYNPDINFTKYIPYAVSAQGMDYVECAEDIHVTVTALNATSAVFYRENIPFSTINHGTYTFEQTDKYKFIAPGFDRGEVRVFDQNTVQLSATATIKFDKLHLPVDSLVYSPYVWLPNPAAGTLTMLYYTGSLNKHFTDAIKHQYSTNSRKNIFAPVLNNINTPSPDIVGVNGLYAVAASPGNEPDFEYYTWVADADLDTLYKYDTLAQLVTSVDLRAVTNLSNVTPASICLDHDKNLWVTCYDALSVLKFDINGNFLFAVDPLLVIPRISPNIPGMFDVTATGANIFDDVPVIEPTCIETDVDNNVWVSFSNPVSSYLIKYSSTGTYITHLQLPVNSTPQDILIDKDNSLWVAECHEIYGDTSVLKKYDSSGAQLSAFDITNLGYLTYDVQGNPWFTYEYNKIGKIQNNLFTHVAQVTSSYAFTNLNIPPITGPSPLKYIEMGALEGIACTHKNLIFVVHTIDNKVYVYNAVDNTLVDTIHITPHLLLGVYNDFNKNRHYSEQWNRSLQVIGDWTGIRWSRKYKTFYFDEKVISGTSMPLEITSLTAHDVRKINQSFNMAENIANLALSPALRSNTFLFDTIIPAIYGTGDYIDDTGTVFYEKIANFLSNHNDIETCEIDQIYRLADMLDIAIDDYRLSFPAQLEQVMNLASISHSRLWGNLQGAGTDIAKSRGNKLDTNTYMVQEGVPFVIYNKPENTFSVHYPATVENLQTYSTSYLTAAGLVAPININYEFFEYIPYNQNNLKGGIIDWDSPHTTISPTQSSYNDWAKEGGIIDNILNFYLYKGLKLI